MIGVAVRHDQLPVVAEFFELFKTPWERVAPGRSYDLVLSADGHTVPRDTTLGLVYGSAEHPLDHQVGVTVEHAIGPVDVELDRCTLPLYGRIARFRGGLDGGQPVATGGAGYRIVNGKTRLRRIGCDLFDEVSRLLTCGQPASRALVPTLERHIAFVRGCLQEAGIAYVEVPPRPHNTAFVCCLTHDVDFLGLRRHRMDRTLAGFLYRATVGTLLDTLRRRRPIAEAARNWLAVLSLPLVFAGLRRDPWDPFGDYAEADRGHGSTFFLVPFKNKAGAAPDGTVDQTRAVPYGIQDIRRELQPVLSRRHELAVHGLDAWRDVDAGRAERAALTSVVGEQHTGVRMHWLFFSDQSHRRLERAGFGYDSTCGYNDAVGFRAGTLQPFRPLGLDHLLELPFAIMDTAMFYPARMGLQRGEASALCAAIVAEARQSGGALVINWHDRSLAPERQWTACYGALLDEVERGGAWFATAGDAAQWFRWRRSIRFVADHRSSAITVSSDPLPDALPAGSFIAHSTAGISESAYRGSAHAFTSPEDFRVAVSQ